MGCNAYVLILGYLMIVEPELSKKFGCIHGPILSMSLFVFESLNLIFGSKDFHGPNVSMPLAH